MMEALGQLAKDGSLLAPTHKHIGGQWTHTQFTSLSGHVMHCIMLRTIDVSSSTECSFDSKACRRFFRVQRSFGEKSGRILASKVYIQGLINFTSAK